MKESPTYKRAVDHLRREFTRLSDMLNENSIPIYSPRYAGHMSFESSLPSILGWLSAMLFNPNNVAFEASPITTLLELDVGFQMCEMLGYPFSNSVKPWGHLTCDGTVANLESIWYVLFSTPRILSDNSHLSTGQVSSYADLNKTELYWGQQPVISNSTLSPFVRQ